MHSRIGFVFGALLGFSVFAASAERVYSEGRQRERERERDRVILVSWDGAGYAMTSRMLEEGALPNLQRLVAEGAWSDGMITSFPTKTAAAHAMVYTGRFGHESGVTANWVLPWPPPEHSRLESESAYFSSPLRVDPLWVLCARGGKKVFSFHSTQQYPFGPFEQALPKEAWSGLYLAHGYTGRSDPAELVDLGVDGLRPASGEWRVPESSQGVAREFAFGVGDRTFYGLVFDDPFNPTEGVDTLGVVESLEVTSFVARIGVSGPFTSLPIVTSIEGERAWFTISLLGLPLDGSRVTFLRSGAAVTAISNEEFPGFGTPDLEAFAGNGATNAYRSGALGRRLVDGGDGTAEDLLLASESRLMDQIVRQARLSFSGDYDVVLLYSPVSDDLAHALTGLVDPELASFDEARAANAWKKIVAGFQIQDRLLGEVMSEADETGAHVVLFSDHGMDGTDRRVYLNLALEHAGMLARGPDGEIDLARTKALAPHLSDFSIAVNTIDRMGGSVPLDEKDEVMAEVRRLFMGLSDPDTGEPVVIAILEPSTHGLLQPGGAGTGDLFLELAPGYYPSSSLQPGPVVTRTEPEGNHGFLPTRREMLAILGLYGPRVPAGVRWPKTRGIDVLPTVLDILGLAVPEDLPGRSLVPARALLEASPERVPPP